MSEPSTATPPPGDTGFMDELSRFMDWCRKYPATALALAAVMAVLVYFLGALHLFSGNAESLAVWAWRAWKPDMNQEHSKIVPLISIGLVWYHRNEIRKAVKQPSNTGMIFVVTGVILFVLSARCLQPRMGLAAVPFLLYGATYYLWGKQVARIVLFPCAFLIFTIPMGAVEQATNNLQFIITGMVGFLSNILGIKIQAVGTTLTAADGTFNFEIAEGCSGIRSITAMAMLTAVYVHLTQNRLWKKIVVFGFSAVFAVIGNIGRIFTVILVARFFDPDIAGGIYHDWSGFVFFPFALLAMLGLGKLINIDFKAVAVPGQPDGPGGTDGRKGDDSTTYDY
jgi:exosortase